MTPDSLTILDWGASHFAGAVFSRTRKSSLRLEAWACEELLPGAGNDPQSRLEAEAAAWRRISCNLGNPRRAVLSLPSPPVVLTPIAVAELDRCNTQRTLEFEGRQALGSDAAGRSRVYCPTGKSNGKSAWVMASMDRAQIDRCVDMLESVGFAVDAAIPQVAALRSLLQVPAEASAGTRALAQIGATSTRFLHQENEGTTMRVLPLGGNTLSRILADELSLPILVAERLKRRLCSGGDLDGIETLLPQRSEGAREGSPGTKEIAAAFHRSREVFLGRLQLELTRAIVNQRQPADAVVPVEIGLLGGGAGVPDLCAELSRKIKLPVRFVDPAGAFERSESVRAFAGIDQGRCAELVNVARTLFFENPEGLSLLGIYRTRAAAIARRQPMMFGIAAMTAVALVPPMISFRNAAATMDRQTGELAREVRALERNRARIAGNLKKIEKAGEEIARWRSFSAARGNWVRFLSELQARLSGAGDMWLDRLQPLAGAGAPASTMGARMVMSGRVLEQATEASAQSAETRVRSFLEAMSASPFVSAFEQERFDRSREGILGFEVILRMNRSETL